MKYLNLIILLLFVRCQHQALNAQLASAIEVGHAHNDYEQNRQPLIAALKSGFVSIEIDVFPHQKEQLKVAHIPFLLSAAPHLEQLYFEPMQAWYKQHGQFFENDQQQLIFMIDIKQNAAETYKRLRRLCMKYQHLIEHYIPSKDLLVKGPLRILLSGHKPYQEVLSDTIQFMSIDGPPSMLKDSLFSTWLMPRISLPYSSFIKWKGHQAIGDKQYKKLKDFVSKVHKSGRKLRFWAAPSNKQVWNTLLEVGVDWIQVDNLQPFVHYYNGLHFENRRRKKINEH